MAIVDRKAKSHSARSAQQQTDQSFAEIDAKKFARARRDPKVEHLLDAADRHIETLRSEGRID